jgi:hypothetical protein
MMKTWLKDNWPVIIVAILVLCILIPVLTATNKRNKERREKITWEYNGKPVFQADIHDYSVALKRAVQATQSSLQVCFVADGVPKQEHCFPVVGIAEPTKKEGDNAKVHREDQVQQGQDPEGDEAAPAR